MQLSTPSHLDAVTVYARGALCIRRAKVALPAGVQQVRVTGLPLSAHAGELRARVEGSSRQVLDVRPMFDVQLAPETDVPVEQKAVEAASATVTELQQDLARLEREIAEVQKLKPAFPAAAPGAPPRQAPVGALLEAGAFVDAELARRFESRRALRQTLQDAQNALELHQRRLREASTAVRAQRARLSRVALVTIGDGAAADLDLAVEYFVPGARWVPSYALRLDSGMGAGTLAIRASVAQCSGEDWSQVKLSLSTAALERQTALTELKSLRIGRAQQPPPRSGWREPPPGLEELFGGFDAAFAMRPLSAPLAPPAPAPMPTPVAAPARPVHVSAPKMIPPPAPPAAARAPAPTARLSLERATSAALSAPMAKLRHGGAFGSAARGADDGASLSETEAEEGTGLEARAEDVGASLAEPPAEAPLELGIEPAANLLSYGSLFMPAASEGRGLLKASPNNSFVFLAAMHLQVDVVVALVEECDLRARSVGTIDLPPRATNPTAGSFDYRYDCAARVDVPSTGTWSMVPVADANVGLHAEYSCVPSVEPKVYRTLRIQNRSTHALLRGPVDVTLGDEFLLTGDFPFVPPGSADARLGLGVEEAIKVARKTQFKETTGGLLGGSTVLPHEVEIEIANRLSTPANIEVRERIPFSTEDDVKIEETRIEPAWEKDEAPREDIATRGARAWHVTVPAGAKTKLTAQFTVRIPSDKMLVGGNRRV